MRNIIAHKSDGDCGCALHLISWLACGNEIKYEDVANLNVLDYEDYSGIG